MKRVISLVLSLAMLLGIMPFTASAADEIIFSDGFENGAPLWRNSSSAAEGLFILNDQYATEGKSSVKVQVPTPLDSTPAFVTKKHPITPETEYTFVMDSVLLGDPAAKVYIRLFDSTGKRTASLPVEPTQGGWNQVVYNFKTEADIVNFELYISINKGKAGELYIDNIRIFKGKTAPTTDLSKFSAPAGISAAPSAPQVTEKPKEEAKVDASVADAKDGDILFSEGFENNAPLWRNSGANAEGLFTLDTTYYTEGQTAVKVRVDTPQESSPAFITRKFPIAPDTEYTFVVDSLLTSGNIAKIYIRLFDANGTRTDSLVVDAPKKGWNEVVYNFKTASNVVNYELYISVNKGSVGEMYLDNIRLYKGKVTPNVDLSKAPAPNLDNVDFIFQDCYEMPEFKPTIGHPRVYFNKDDIETIKANSSHPQNQHAYKTLLKEIESTADGSLSSKTGNNLNTTIMAIIQSKAFYYAIWGDEQKGKEAISMLKNFLNDANPELSEYTAQGYLVFTIAAVYDWCYPLLTKEDMKYFQNKGMEVASTTEMGFPPVKGSVYNGHGAEGMLLRDMMCLALAVYDERPDIYQNIAGRYFSESVPTIKHLAQAKSSPFGNSYVTLRNQWEGSSLFIMDAVGLPNIYGEDHQKILYWLLYGRRPDGSSIVDGDSVSNNQPIRSYDERGTKAFFLAGNYYKDPYLKGEFLRHNNGVIMGEAVGTATLSSLEVLCFNDPSVGYKSVEDLPLSIYYPAPRGEILARTSWAEGINAPTVVAQMKVDEYWTQGHDHLDSGEFEIYYKGALATDTGYYQAGREGSNKENSGNTVYGTVHFYNYYRRTIAHNCMIVFDPNEDVKASYRNYSNDGGQIFANGEAAVPSVYAISEESHVAKVLGQEIGTDTIQPDYSYLKGDLAKAYGEKVPEYERSFIFLNLKNSDTPAAMVVFDRVVSKDKSFDKKWVLHGHSEPEINGSRTVFKDTREGYNGKMTVDTLLPKADNLTINTIGGKDNEYLVNGVNYWAQTLGGAYNEAGGYRVEVSPKEDATQDYFLNVIQVADASSTSEPLVSEMIESETHTGVKVADRVVMFGKLRDRVSSDIKFKVSGDGWFKYTVADLKEGTWKVTKDGAALCEIVATKDGGLGSFEADTGAYTLSYLGEYGEKTFTSTPLPTTEGINLKLEPANKYIYSDVAPFTVNGRTLVPLRAIFEALDAKVTWDEATATATGEKDGVVIKITENSEIAYVDGNEYKLDAPAMVKDGRFVVPVRFVAESFGINVSWDDFSKTVIIRTAGMTPGSNSASGKFTSKLVPNALTVYNIEQSGDDGAGDDITLAFDNAYGTNWAVREDAKGNPGYGIFDLGSVKTIDSISCSYMQGTKRVYTFSIYVSDDGVNYTLVKENLKSSGTTTEIETFDLGGVKGRYVKYVGHGNSVNTWNSISEIAISGR